jgi:signal transduction histidine kinase/CheY-like chemotaxis protein
VTLPLLSVAVGQERDVVVARRRARQVAAVLGFDAQDQTRIASAVSEMARNAFTYAAGGRVEFLVEGRTPPQLLLIRVVDRGPGIADLDAVLSGRYRSRTGMGVGILGTRRLMDTFDVESSPAGTTVTMRKIMSRRAEAVTPAALPALAEALARPVGDDPLTELQQQNQELLRALDELHRRQAELARLNHEIEDTNRGVVALYAELDEKADHLRRADELKSRFLSNMSHEFRTPLNSILSLSRLLLDRLDGELTPEQETQIGFIRRAASDLSDLVNDLLDLAKVEAGKTVIRAVEFRVENLFGALRGMLRPLLVNPALALVFEDANDLPPLHTDESKISQILRNFISNALKFTERGEIRVSARAAEDGEVVIFSVTDTGIGIAPEDQEAIFDEFVQIDTRLQHRVRGTGLGLPLTRKLARLLGGEVSLVSQPGLGSTFSLRVPRRLPLPVAEGEAAAAAPAAVLDWRPDPVRRPVLVVEDGVDAMLAYQTFLRGTPYQALPVRSTFEAREVLRTVRPVAVILDILLPGEASWSFLAEIKRDAATRDVPVIVVTEVEDAQKAFALGADRYAAKPVEREWLLERLGELAGGEALRVLVIDDDPAARYLLKMALRDTPCFVSEVESGDEGLRVARAEHPDVVFCDLRLPGMPGEIVVRTLAEDPTTRDIPVVVSTVRSLSGEERRALERHAVAILPKSAFADGSAPRQIREALVRAGVAR